MVRLRARRLNERGKGRTGCLLTILIVVAVTYFGVPIVGTYVRYYRFRNEMQTQARFAPSLNDATIRRRLLLSIESLGLPEGTRLRIRRATREIVIAASWQEPLEFPFYVYIITFEPEIRERT